MTSRPITPSRFEASRAGDNSVWRLPDPGRGGPGEHIMSAVGDFGAATELAELLDRAVELAPRLTGDGNAKVARAVAKAMGGTIDLASFGLL